MSRKAKILPAVLALSFSLGSIASPQVRGNSGSFTTSVPIAVPSFHGVEPEIALAYNSSGANSIVGVGWSLTGFSYVERQGTDGGSPQFDPTDSFRLGGTNLRACGASSSPGCLAGGTHFTEYENYQRITYDSGQDEWTVDQQDGTQRTYTPVFSVSAQTFRWGMTSVEDTLGNAVTYNWSCDGTDDCYPDNVTYNGYRVKIYYREDRTDVMSFATGASIAETARLVRTIKVELTDGTPIRAYALTHSTSTSTKRSRLDFVQMYGNDVHVDDITGVISSGSVLPPETFTYTTDANEDAFTDGSAWMAGCTKQTGTGDFNGDGLQDVYCYARATGEIKVGISTGTSFTVSDWGPYCDGVVDSSFSTGDFNGDGKTDFRCRTQAKEKIGLSTGTSLSWSQWLGQWCDGGGGNDLLVPGDFNGDGKTDLSCRNGTTFNVKVLLSDGSSFSDAGHWLTNWCRDTGGSSHGESWGAAAKAMVPGDFNGDGNIDLLCRGTYGGGAGPWIALSDGSSLTHDGAWTDTSGQASDLRGVGDFNGDGKMDIYHYDNGGAGANWDVQVGLSDGSDFHVSQWLGSNTCDTFGFSDVNADGLSDVWCHKDAGSEEWVGLGDGHAQFASLTLWRSNWCSSYTRKMMPGDFNGDGKTDLFCKGSTNSMVALAGGIVNKTDLLATVQSSIGGTTTVTYAPGTQWSNTSVAPPPSLSVNDDVSDTSTSPSTHKRTPGAPTVTSVTADDGRGWTKTTTYEYSGGVYDSDEQRSLGFSYFKSTEPALPGETAGPYAETWFKQEIAAVGAVDKIESRGGDGSLLDSLDNLFTTGGDGDTDPWTSKITGSYSYIFDGSGTACGAWPCTYGERRYAEYDYDAYGNRVQTRDYGNLDASGDDEVTTVMEFYPDTSGYITNRTARTVTYFGIGTAGATLTDALSFYDDSLSYNQSPVAGLLTNESVWLDTENRYISGCASGVCIEYDVYGNVTKTTDTKGAQTTTLYDSSYNLFPTSVTNALTHQSTTVWDEVCQAPTARTDPNSQVSTTSYDVFCRHDRTDGPLGAFTETKYASLGNPATQHTETLSPSPDGAGNHWARTYFDGLGRTYASTSRGAGPDITSGEVTFNARGSIVTTARTRFAGETQYNTTYAHDVRNRPVLATLPDSATESAVYGLNFTLNYNPEGHLTATSRNATGLVSYLVEYLGATPIVTTTVRDIDGRSETVIDAAGNGWLTNYDSLGRVVSLYDPDSGVKANEHNDAGELTATINSLGQRTELTYDLLGRMLTKTTRVGTPDEETTTFIYDEPRSGYYNIGSLTSMIDTAGHRLSDYDAQGRLARDERSIDAVNYVFTHAYNTAGLPASTTYPDSQTISWTYDAAGNLQTETGTITTASYDAVGRPTSLSFASGVITTYTYSPTRGWVDNIYTATGGIIHQNLTYSRYSDGMISTITSAQPMESWTYVYDDLNRLLVSTNVDTPSLTQSFTYDNVGNMTYNSNIGSYAYPTPGTPRPHAVQTAGTRSYVYDGAGRMTSRNGQVLTWNGDDKPATIGSVQFTYGGTGERLKKVSGADTTRYVNGDYEIAPTGTVTKYLRGGKQVGAAFFLNHSDHLGSIQAVTDTVGVAVRRQDHTPFGDQHYATGSHAESKGWIGEREEETELVYLNARYYDPEIGRFTAPDPIVLPGQLLNRYSYAANNPINLLDPSGLLPIDPELDRSLPPGTIEGPRKAKPRPPRKAVPKPPRPAPPDPSGPRGYPDDPDSPRVPKGPPPTLDPTDCALIAGAPDCTEVAFEPPDPITETCTLEVVVELVVEPDELEGLPPKAKRITTTTYTCVPLD